MTITEENSVHTHTLKTLWSETLFEMLYESIQHNWSSNAVREILKELLQKGYRMQHLKRKVQKRFGEEGVRRLTRKMYS